MWRPLPSVAGTYGPPPIPFRPVAERVERAGKLALVPDESPTAGWYGCFLRSSPMSCPPRVSSRRTWCSSGSRHRGRPTASASQPSESRRTTRIGLSCIGRPKPGGGGQGRTDADLVDAACHPSDDVHRFRPFAKNGNPQMRSGPAVLAAHHHEHHDDGRREGQRGRAVDDAGHEACRRPSAGRSRASRSHTAPRIVRAARRARSLCRAPPDGRGRRAGGVALSSRHLARAARGGCPRSLFRGRRFSDVGRFVRTEF